MLYHHANMISGGYFDANKSSTRVVYEVDDADYNPHQEQWQSCHKLAGYLACKVSFNWQTQQQMT